MRASFIRFCFVCAICCVSVLPVQAENTLPDLGGITVHAVTGNDYRPLNFIDPTSGKGIGLEYDAVNAICERLNCVVAWHVSAWDTMISAVRNGQFDVGMDGISITAERKKQIDFSIPYITSEMFMLVRTNEDRFVDAKSFAANSNLLIGSQVGTTNFYVAVYDVLDGNEGNPRIKSFETFGAAVQALVVGDVDMVLMDASSARGYVGARPNLLKTIGGPLGHDEFGFIFTPDSKLVNAFNAAIKSMIDDKTMEALQTKWFYEYQ